jgi:hypothetical protein
MYIYSYDPLSHSLNIQDIYISIQSDYVSLASL